ncbi:unnamed protein product [Didymodactylos carnosus]|uniref:Uncharacterized protein n=1 Tax=Didymodactylos carnosus TaxID=1234261 RepID=A0A8S2GGL0_9BILA|nr:unnamed protein product [Didymodactylos carnosus]CAF3517311.1 unnamed protein product [Didymodactylos carnosus]
MRETSEQAPNLEESYLPYRRPGRADPCPVIRPFYKRIIVGSSVAVVILIVVVAIVVAVTLAKTTTSTISNLYSGNIVVRALYNPELAISSSSLYRNYQRQLCELTFSNIDECLNCVKENEKKLIYFIVSGRLGEKIISYIHPMVQTQSVYVFCSNILRHTQWATQHSKIRGVFNDIKPLCEQLKRELLWFIPLEQNLYSITTTVQYPENSFTPDENDDPAEFFKHYCIDIPFSRRQSFSIQDQNNNQEFCKQSNSHDEESNDPSKFDEGILRKCDEFDCCQKQIDDLPSSSIPTSLIITDDVNCQTHEESSIIVDHKESNLVTASTLISSAHSNNLSKIVDKSLECIKEKGHMITRNDFRILPSEQHRYRLLVKESY